MMRRAWIRLSGRWAMDPRVRLGRGKLFVLWLLSKAGRRACGRLSR